MVKIVIIGCVSVTSFVFAWLTFDLFELTRSYSMLVCLSSIYYVFEILILVRLRIIKLKEYNLKHYN